jgi:DNA primase
VHHKALCPFHDDRHPSLSFRVSKNTYRCFVCGASGGTIDLVMRHLHVDFKEACRWLADTHLLTPPGWEGSLDSTNYMNTPPSREGKGVGFDASRYERFFEHPWLLPEARKFLFDERRLDPRVVRWCRLTSWTDKQGTPWLQIPYYDRSGRLTGVQNRNLIRGALPRFRFPSGSKCGIYNLPVLNMLRPGEPLFITEGSSDCWAMLSAGHKAIAIPSATLLTQDVRSKMADGRSNSSLLTLNSSLGITFHMFPDRDAPGERLFLQLQKVLPTLQHHQLPPDCKDFSDYYLTHLRKPP